MFMLRIKQTMQLQKIYNDANTNSYRNLSTKVYYLEMVVHYLVTFWLWGVQRQLIDRREVVRGRGPAH